MIAYDSYKCIFIIQHFTFGRMHITIKFYIPLVAEGTLVLHFSGCSGMYVADCSEKRKLHIIVYNN